MKRADTFVGPTTKTISARNLRYWFLCACGWWRGVNSRFRCSNCSRLPPNWRKHRAEDKRRNDVALRAIRALVRAR